MMRFLFALIIFLDCRVVFAADLAPLYFTYQGKRVAIPLIRIRTGTFSRGCQDKVPECLAIQAFKGKRQRFFQSALGSTALSYCKQLGAEPVRLQAQDLSEHPYCLFSDKSFVGAWDIYQAHWEKK